MNSLLFSGAVLEKVKSSSAPTAYAPLWQADLEAFLKSRAKYLIYD